MAASLKVLIYSAGATGTGGVQSFTRRLADALKECHGLSVLGLDYALPASRSPHARIFSKLRARARLLRCCRAGCPDWIISTEWDPCGYFAERVRRRGVPRTLCVIHGQEIYRVPTGLRGRVKGAVRDRLFSTCTALVAVSSYTTDRLRAQGVTRQVAIIGNMAPEVSALCSREVFHNEQLRLITLARLVERKGHRYAILALHELVSRGVDATYDIIGTGPEELPLRELCESLALSGRVRFHGRLTDLECQEMLGAADVFVHPNFATRDGRDFEGFGIVLLEAMARGLPVIAGADGGSADVVDHGVNGFLVSPQSAEQIVDAVLALRCDRDRTCSIIQAGFETCQRFSPHSIVKQYLSILRT